jgi:O-acetyl-ADP-ribose deacetylase (regulator of RNase III)
MNALHLILVDPNAPLIAAWEAEFADLPNVELIHGGFEYLAAFDCMVSPANSFGIMDGGVDLAISHFFGWSLMERVQKRIVEEFLGEQPVGTSIIVETGKAKHPYLSHTPTMRVPMPIAHTDHVYTAMGAMLLAVHRHNLNSERPIEIVACPGLGTGTGRMPYREAARQMALAYRHFLNPPKVITWQFAAQRQDAVRTGGDIGLMMPPGIRP